VLDQIADDYWLRPIPPEDMPALAARLLAGGHDTPALRQAAALTASADPRDIRDAFRAALAELGSWVPDYLTAQLRASSRAAGDLLAGRASIEECARRIREVCEFDEVISRALPADLDELALLSWLLPGAEYDAGGGDDRLLRAARAVAVRNAS
jgi:hypothetical protein